MPSRIHKSIQNKKKIGQTAGGWDKHSFIPGSSNGRTTDSDSVNHGSNPWPGSLDSHNKKKHDNDSDLQEPGEVLVPFDKETGPPALLDPLQQYLTEVNRYPLLTREEEMETVHHYHKFHDKESAQKLVVSNLRLVVKIALEYNRAFHNLLDLIQEGNIGLLKAVKKYDPAKGTRFSYYASWWIRAFILKYIIDNFRLVKIGTTQAQKKLFYNLMKEKRKLEALGFAPESRLLSERLDVKEKDVVQMEQRMMASDLSLDAPTPHAEGKVNLDFFSDDSVPVDVKVEEDELKKNLFAHMQEFVSGLKEKEKKIFKERLYAEVPKTLQEIADEYGITRERIRQLEERVVAKLRTFFKHKGFEVEKK